MGITAIPPCGWRRRIRQLPHCVDEGKDLSVAAQRNSAARRGPVKSAGVVCDGWRVIFWFG
jgi:hypothetical protein